MSRTSKCNLILTFYASDIFIIMHFRLLILLQDQEHISSSFLQSIRQQKTQKTRSIFKIHLSSLSSTLTAVACLVSKNFLKIYMPVLPSLAVTEATRSAHEGQL